MRTVIRLALMGLVGGFTMVLAPGAVRGQEVSLAERGPRFLAMARSTAEPVEVDVSSAPLLMRRVSIRLEATTLGAALRSIASQAKVQFAYSADVLPLDRPVALRAENITVAAALLELLIDTGVDVMLQPGRKLALVKRIAAQTGTVVGRVTDKRGGEPIVGGTVELQGTQLGAVSGNDGRYRLERVPVGAHTLRARYIGYAPGAVTITVTEGQEATADFTLEKATTLGELVVTAQKREERLQDVPIPVTAIATDKLVADNQLRLQDYYTEVPGLSVSTSSVGGYQLLSIRGITTGLANPSVGITVDDVPYGSSTLYGGNVPADIDPGDLARVEVLRGPQGTLYGASSIGGLIKFVTVDPSMDHLSGRVQGGSAAVYNGGELGYNVRGAINLPLSKTWAVRASGLYRKEPGYIDNPVLNIDGINKAEAYGGHLSVLWQPSEMFSLKLSALGQRLDADGSPDVNKPTEGFALPDLGDLQQSYIPGAGAYRTRIQAYSATLRAKLGKAVLTAVSGYNINKYRNTIDFTYAYGPFTENGVPDTGFDGFGVPGTLLNGDVRTRKFSQEIRFSTPISRRFDWQLGAFYTHEDNSPFVTSLLAEHPTTGAIVGLFGAFDQPSTYKEYAAFTNLTYHVTERFDVQVGGRRSHIKQTNQETDSGPFVPVFEGVPSPNVGPVFESKANAFTYLVTPRLKVSQDLMVYARLASGYRAGGPNPVIGVPPQYEPDKTYNYEVGIKGDVLRGALSFDASVYHIQWKDMQLSVSNPVSGLSYTANAGQAKSQGVELSLGAIPLTGLKFTGWAAWNAAELTEPLPPGFAGIAAVGASGDRLPYSSRFSGSMSLEQEFSLWSRASGFVGASMSYVGDRQGVFTATPERENFPAYAQADVRAGAKHDSWSVDLVINNVFDRRGLIDGGLGTNIPFDFHYIQPRTVGLSLLKEF